MIDPMNLATEIRRLRRSGRKAKGDGYLRRAEILRAAERIFIVDGYEGATIRKIADEVGVSSTCLYMHFRDKDEILREICTAALEELLEQNSKIAALPVDAVERTRLMLRAYIEFALRNPNAYRLVFCSPVVAGTPERATTAKEIGDSCGERFLTVVREIAAEGRLKTGDPHTVHQALWAACHGLVSLMITKPDRDWASAEDLTGVLVDGLLFGLIAD